MRICRIAKKSCDVASNHLKELDPNMKSAIELHGFSAMKHLNFDNKSDADKIKYVESVLQLLSTATVAISVIMREAPKVDLGPASVCAAMDLMRVAVISRQFGNVVGHDLGKTASYVAFHLRKTI